MMRQTFLCFLLPAACLARAGQAPLIPRAAFFAGIHHALPQVSPDGKQLAWIATHQGRYNLFVRPLAGGQARALTHFGDHSVRYFHWRFDSRALLFYRDDAGDEDYRLYQIGLEGGKHKDLNPKGAYAWTNLEFNPRFPLEALVQLRTRDSGYYLYRLNLASGAISPVDRVPGWIWADNDFQPRLAMEGMESRLFKSRASKDAPWKALYTLKLGEIFGGVQGFSPDNRSAYVADSQDGDRSRLFQMDLSSGARKVLAEDPQFDFESVLIDPKSLLPLAASFYGERRRWVFLDQACARDFARLEALEGGDISIVSQDQAGRLWSVAFENPDRPPSYYLFDRSSGKGEFLFSGLPALEGRKLARTRPVSFNARDGMLLHAYLSLPPGLEPKGLPLVVLVHGGPWARDTQAFDPELQWLCDRGYAVLQVNFRGSTGYGRAYLDAGNREWGGKMSTDLLDGKAWALAQGVADPKRVAIYGASYGGYAALAGLAFSPGEYRCGVDLFGPSSLLTLFRNIREAWGPSILDYRIGRLDWQKNLLRRRSPLHSAGSIQEPLFISQGANDPRVPQEESDQMVEALKRRGKPVRYLLYGDEGHGYDKWEHQLSMYEALEEFLAAHMGGRKEEPQFGSDKERSGDRKLVSEDLAVNQLAVDSGDTFAMNALAERHLGGQGVTKSAELALEWFLKAAATGEGWVQIAVGDAFAQGNHGFSDPAQARRWYQAAARQGNPRGTYALAKMMEDGLDGPQGREGALAQLQVAAKDGDILAKRDLALRLRSGQGLSADPVRARALMEEAAKEDYRAGFHLAYMLEKGEGGPRDPRRAKALYDAGLGPQGSFQWNLSPAVVAQAPPGMDPRRGLAAFASVTPLVLASSPSSHVVVGRHRESDPLRAEIRLMRDATHLYLGCRVEQGRPPLNRKLRGQGLWDGDAIEFFISSRSAFSGRTRGAKCGFDYEFTFAPTTKEGIPGWEAAQGGVEPELRVQAGAGGYNLVAAIPLAGMLGLDWVSGALTRFEVAVAKAGAGGARALKVYWNSPDDEAYDRPDQWGLAKFE